LGVRRQEVMAKKDILAASDGGQVPFRNCSLLEVLTFRNSKSLRDALSRIGEKWRFAFADSRDEDARR
jgi:hypothetical protein